MEEVKKFLQNGVNIKKQVLSEIKELKNKTNGIIGNTKKEKLDFDNNTNEIFYSLDSRGVIKYISPQIKNYGFLPEELLSNKFTNFVVSLDKERIFSEFHKTLITGEEFISRFRIKNKDGNIYWFEEKGKVQYSKLGKVIGLKGVLHDITGHMQVREKLKGEFLSIEAFTAKNYKDLMQIEEKINKLRNDESIILNNMQEYVIYQDLNNKIIWANKAAAGSVGLSFEELQGHYCYELWQGRNKPCEGCPILKVKETGQSQSGKMVSPDGKVWYVKGTPVKDANGVIKGIIEIVLDITEQEKIKVALERKEKVIDCSICAVAISDLEGKLLYVNSSFIKMWGFNNNDEIIGKPASDFWEFKEKVLNVLEIIKKEEIWVGELVAKKKDKSFFNAEVFANLIKDKKGNPLYLASSFINITEQKKMEDSLKQSENRFKAVTEESLTGVYLIKDCKFIYVNPALCKMFGYKKNELINKLGPLDLTHPDDREIVRRNMAKKINREQKVTHYLFKGLRKNGDVIFCESLGKWIEINRKPAVIGNLIDVTQRVKSKNELNNLNEELKRTNNRLKELALKDIHTGLYNYRYLKQSIESEFKRAKRYNLPLSVIVLDIDYFKSINDTYGYQFGDLILKQLAEQFTKIIRSYDTVARFGSNTFVIISPESDRIKSLSLAQRILENINLCNFGDKKTTVKLGLSIGIASWTEDKIFSSVELIDIADKILNKAKEDGGNRVYTSNNLYSGEVLIKHNEDDVKFLKSRIEKLSKESNQSLIESVFAFAKTIKLKDYYTGEHVENTVTYALEIGRGLGLRDKELENVRRAAILHDLGKLGISESILNKKTKLNEEEFEEIKKHPQIGVDIIRPLRFLHDIIPFILYHHERFDGKGYPKGLEGEDIPIGARIIAVADVYQALISDRPYRKAYSELKAFNMIKNESGTHFDPKIINLFIKILKKNK